MRSIKNIELASVCNMSCSYCLSPQIKDHRTPGLMSFETFEKVVDQIENFYNQGTQGEIWLHGTGESLLNKDLLEMVRYLVGRVPILPFISTNGILVDAEMAEGLKEAGARRVDVSYHDPEVADKAYEILKEHGVPTVINYGPRDSRFNWADQLEVENVVDSNPPCPWIANQECFVMHDGSVVSCCFDVFGKKILGTIDDDLSTIDISEFELCKTCNHTN